MDNQEKEVSESDSEHLYGSSEQISVKRKRWRLDVLEECKVPLNDLANQLSLRSMGAAIPWILPSETKLEALVDLTEKLGYEKGGETIDSLLQMGSDELLFRLTRERGFPNVAETLNWCVPNNTKRLVELTDELGFKTGAQTLNLILSNITRPMLKQLTRIAAVKDIPSSLSSAMNIPAGFPPVQFQTPTFRRLEGAPEPSSSPKQQSFITNRNPEPPLLGLSAGNYHSVARHPLQEPIPEELNAIQFQDRKIHGRFPFPSTVNEQSHYQFKDPIAMVQGKQPRNQNGSNSSGLQGGQTTNRNPERPAVGPSAGNHNVARHPLHEPMPQEINANQFQDRKMHGGFPVPSTVNEQPHYPFKGPVGMVEEMQQLNQFGCNSSELNQFGSNSSGLQGEQTMNQYFNGSRDLDNLFNGSRDLDNLSNCFKRRAIEPGNYDHPGNKLPTPFPYVREGNQIMHVPRNIVPEQGLNENTTTGVDGIYDQGFQNSWLARMQSKIQVQNNRIDLGETSQQNYWNQYYNQSGIHQAYRPDVPMNPHNHLIPEQSEFRVSDWKQYENQGGNQMGGTHEGTEDPHQRKSRSMRVLLISLSPTMLPKGREGYAILDLIIGERNKEGILSVFKLYEFQVL